MSANLKIICSLLSAILSWTEVGIRGLCPVEDLNFIYSICIVFR